MNLPIVFIHKGYIAVIWNFLCARQNTAVRVSEIILLGDEANDAVRFCYTC